MGVGLKEMEATSQFCPAFLVLSILSKIGLVHAQSCLTPFNILDHSLLGSSVHGVFQARVMEWVAISLRDLPDPGIVPRSPVLQADSLLSKPLGKPRS